MKKVKKKRISKFRNEDEEREFWASHDSTDYIDWSEAKEFGWVLEPEAKRLLSISGIDVPKFLWARSSEEATQFAGEIGYPVVAKLISPKALH